MTETTTTKARYAYAIRHPRGFKNEKLVFRFASEQERDAWVENHPEPMAAMAPYPATVKEARQAMKDEGSGERYFDTKPDLDFS